MSKKPEPRNLERDRIRRALARVAHGSPPGVLAAAVQRALDYVPEKAIEPIARQAGTSPDEVLRAMEQDEALRRAPRGHHRITICTGRTCARRGGAPLVRLARKTLGIELYSATPDESIRIEPFRCFGECAMAPNVRIDGGTRGAMTESRFRLLLVVLTRSAT